MNYLLKKNKKIKKYKENKHYKIKNRNFKNKIK